MFYPKRLLHNACAGYILEASVFHCGLQYNKGMVWNLLHPTEKMIGRDLRIFLYQRCFFQTIWGRKISSKIILGMTKEPLSAVKYAAKGTYLYISNIALTIAQTTRNWVMGKS